VKKEIRTVDPERGIVQVTTLDERWYDRVEPDPETGLDRVVWRPSVTWITSYYPKGRGFEIWLKRNGDDADVIAQLAADRGYKVHRAIAQLNGGESVRMEDRFLNPTTGKEEELTPDEYAAVLAYVEWWNAEGKDRYRILGFEYTIWPDKDMLAETYNLPADAFDYAGTIDVKMLRLSDGAVGVVDMKTSQEIWPSHEIQVSAYRVAEGAEWGAILQLNYRKTKTRRYKFTMLDDKFRLFLATRQIWANETAGVVPLQRDFPLMTSL